MRDVTCYITIKNGGPCCRFVYDHVERKGKEKGTLFKCLVVLAWSTNWGHCKLKLTINANEVKCWLLRRGENRSTRRKTSRCRVENQQTRPTYDAESGNRTRATLVGGECSHHCAIPAPLVHILMNKIKRW